MPSFHMREEVLNPFHMDALQSWLVALLSGLLGHHAGAY